MNNCHVTHINLIEKKALYIIDLYNLTSLSCTILFIIKTTVAYKKSPVEEGNPII